MADEKKNPLGSTGQRVQANVLRLREARGLSKKDLADRTRELGRPIPPLGISRIEAGTRRVDADDLVALADALNVSPATLLLPATFGDDPVKLTDNHEVTSRTAWQWSAGQRPAMDWEPGEGVSLAEPGADPAMAREAYEREQEYDRRRAEYMTLALPQGLRRTADHPLVRLTQQLEGLVEDIVGPRGDRDDRARWSRMALRRVEQLRLNLEEVGEALTHGDGLDEVKRQYPGMISHVQVGADGTVTNVSEPTGEGANAEDQ
ncbi:helix-turn-helix domain-containing protein [Streptomyces sp. NPDC020192]|uniref:helix-turn-helix domain-containing protein n=1 Tax=Streptomyces sp. NPDC020192 TaxID=3365066 RepID=UPI0037935DB0